jgi:NAD(P)-dependent dehydrogenase (short-subunit alcohol dehydrogenase family)
MIKRTVKESASLINTRLVSGRPGQQNCSQTDWRSTSSIAGLGGNVGTFVYTMSKHAVTGATKFASQGTSLASF